MNTTLTKQSTFFHWDSYGMMEYLVVLYTGRQVLQKVLNEKAAFCQLYGERLVNITDSYINIANFLAKEAMEETLTRWITNICNKHQRFQLSLNNYGGLPPDTIYLRIQDLSPICGLINQLKILDDFIMASDCPPLKFLPKPHLPIAKKLPMDIYDKALKDYSQKDFHESFMVEELVLLKRSHQFDASTTVNKFRFAHKS